MRIEPRDEARAQSAWQDADALDGGRAAGVGESAFPKRARASASVVLHAAEGRNVVVRLDGAPLAGKPSGGGRVTYAIDAPAAEHQLVVYLDGEPVFASWVALAAGAGPALTGIDVRLPDGGACAAASFGGVAREGGAVRASGVTCARWVAATPGENRGSVFVARCERDACGPLLEWRTEGLTPGPAIPSTKARPWPAWATWTLVGFGAATATAITLVATGAFESRPSEPRFVAGGVRIESR
jgi:hypothetical protein